MEPTEEQGRRASAALVPFVSRWDLPLNPENLDEMAYAVLAHFDNVDPPERAYAAIEQEVNAQLDEFERSNATINVSTKRGLMQKFTWYALTLGGLAFLVLGGIVHSCGT